MGTERVTLLLELDVPEGLRAAALADYLTLHSREHGAAVVSCSLSWATGAEEAGPDFRHVTAWDLKPGMVLVGISDRVITQVARFQEHPAGNYEVRVSSGTTPATAVTNVFRPDHPVRVRRRTAGGALL